MSLSKGRLAREWLLGKAMSVLRPRVFLKRMSHRLIATFWLFRLVCDVLDTTANYDNRKLCNERCVLSGLAT